MLLDLKIIKNYSQALYSEAKNFKIENKVLEQISFLGKVLSHSSNLKKALNSPIVDNKIKKNIIDQLAAKCNFEQSVLNFLYILIKNSRFYLIFNIIDNYAKIVAENNNTKYVQVISANKLSKKEQELIMGFLESKLSKKIILETNIDSSLIGGVVIKYDCNLIDCSVSGILDRIKKVTLGLKV